MPTFHFAAGDLVRLDGLKVVSQGRTREAMDRRPCALEEGRGLRPDPGGQTGAAAARRRRVQLGHGRLGPGGRDRRGPAPGDRQRRRPPAHTIEIGGGYTSGGYPSQTRASPRSAIRPARAPASTPSGSSTIGWARPTRSRSPGAWRRSSRSSTPNSTCQTGGGPIRPSRSAPTSSPTTPPPSTTTASACAPTSQRHFTKTTYIGYGGAIDVVDTREKHGDQRQRHRGRREPEAGDLLGAGPVRARPLERPPEPDARLAAAGRGRPDLHRRRPQSGLPEAAGPGRAATCRSMPDQATVLAARLKLGSIVGGSIPDGAGRPALLRRRRRLGARLQLPGRGAAAGRRHADRRRFAVRVLVRGAPARQRTVERRRLHRRRVARPDRRPGLRPRRASARASACATTSASGRSASTSPPRLRAARAIRSRSSTSASGRAFDGEDARVRRGRTWGTAAEAAATTPKSAPRRRRRGPGPGRVR